MHASDTALLAFQDVRVPDDAVLGQVGKGFYHIMWELQGERLIGAAGCVAGAQRVLRPDAPVRAGAHRVRPPDRQVPGRSATSSPRWRRRSRRRARWSTRPPGASQNGEYPVREISMAKLLRRADRRRGRRRVHPDPRRRRLHEGVRRRARLARHAPEPHRRRHRRDHARRDRPLVRALGGSTWESIVSGPGYAVGNLELLGEGYGFRKIRKGLDVKELGVNAIVMPPGYETAGHYHDEQEELYFVHRGRIAITFGDGTTHELGAGGLGARRRADRALDQERRRGRRDLRDRRGEGRLRRARRPHGRGPVGRGRAARRAAVTQPCTDAAPSPGRRHGGRALGQRSRVRRRGRCRRFTRGARGAAAGDAGVRRGGAAPHAAEWEDGALVPERGLPRMRRARAGSG